MAELDRLSINQITVRSWDLRETVAGLRRHGIGSIGLWIDKVEEVGLAESAQLVQDHGLGVSSLCRAGFFETWVSGVSDENQRAIEIAHAVGADCLYVVCGGIGEGRDLPGARRRAQDALAEMAELASQAGVLLALEPLHPMMTADRCVVVTLDQALDLVEAIDSDAVGVAVDTYNVWWDPRLQESLQRAGRRAISYQVCDWLVPQPHPVFGRGMPGDGVIDFPSITEAVARAGYRGPIEVEIFNEEVWAREPDDVLSALVETFHLV